MLLIILFISLIIWPIVRIIIEVYILKKITIKNKTQLWEAFIGYLSIRAERKIFQNYLIAMTTIAGIFPYVLVVCFEYISANFNLNFELKIEENQDLISVIFAVLITSIYAWRLYLINNTPKKELRQIKKGVQEIHSNFKFIPTEKWFSEQNQKAFLMLGTRYSELINFPYKNTPLAVAVTAKDKNLIIELFKEEFLEYLKAVREVRKSTNNDNENLGVIIDETNKLINEISHFDINNIPNIKSIINYLSSLCYKYSYQENHKSKSTNYHSKSLYESIHKLNTTITNEWFDFLQMKTLFILGNAGIGKSHFVGELITQRKVKRMPSILLLGQQFSVVSNPINQILELLDIHCNYVSFFENLNEYGKSIGKRILVIIDAINEGAGISYWKNHINSLIFEFEKYEFLGLIISMRTSNNTNIDDILPNYQNYAIYNHLGFKETQFEACEYMFRSFKLDMPQWPIYGKEFENPLFLIKYCRSHELSQKPLVLEDFWTTTQSYCNEINKILSSKYNYNHAQTLVFNSMLKVAELMIKNNVRWSLEFNDVIKELTEIAKYTKEPYNFITYLIEEGLLQDNNINGNHIIDFAYERFGDYFIAYYLIKNNLVEKWLKNNYYFDLEALSILYPKLKNRELYTINAPVPIKRKCFIAFINSLTWRETLTNDGIKYINTIKKSSNIKTLINISCKCLYKKGFPINADTLYINLWNLNLAERDYFWTTEISDYDNECYHYLSSLAEWGTKATSFLIKKLDDETLRLCSEGLIWTLSSTNRILRDKATHALVNLLLDRTEILIKLINKYYNINDPYIEERLWSVVYGITMCCQSPQISIRLALETYNINFRKKEISENILVRDYINGIIKYGIFLDPTISIDNKRITPPYKRVSIPNIPSGEDINKKYKIDFDKINNKDLYIAQNSILESMATEHSTREHMYGDFGRYVFQSNLSAFPVNPEKMSCWAIHMIFEEYGYDAHKFLLFDSNCSRYGGVRNKVERIGKKYQYIAMYRIMAILADYYRNIDIDSSWHDPWLSARSIDPTLSQEGRKTDYTFSVYKIPLCDLSAIPDDNTWMKSIKAMPSLIDFLQQESKSKTEWINLFSYNKQVLSPINIQSDSYTRDLWVFVQSFLVDKKYAKTICKLIYKLGIEGRSFHENGDIYNLYCREFFWSENYLKNVESTGYYSHIPFSIGHICKDDITIEPTYLKYQQDTDIDASHEESASILFPSGYIYNSLNLMYAKQNGSWVNHLGEVKCFDNKVYGHGDQALMIEKKSLIKLLKEKGKILIWPILIERMLRTDYGSGSHYIQCGGYAVMDEKGQIKYKIRSYEITKFDTWKKVQVTRLNKIKNCIKRILVKHNIINVSVAEKYRLFYNEDFNSLDFNKIFNNDKEDDLI